jgi:hypothetical protein
MCPTSNSLAATMAVLVVFSIFCQQSAGLSFGIVPFVSKRSTGLVSGFVGSGGNVGGAVTQVRTLNRHQDDQAPGRSHVHAQLSQPHNVCGTRSGGVGMHWLIRNDWPVALVLLLNKHVWM